MSLFLTLLFECKLIEAFLQVIWQRVSRLKTKPNILTSYIPLLGINLKEIIMDKHEDLATKIFITTLFIAVKNCKLSKYLTRD